MPKKKIKKKSNAFHLSNVRIVSEYKKKRMKALESGKDFPTLTEYKKKMRKKK